jgi:hypothetical protein
MMKTTRSAALGLFLCVCLSPLALRAQIPDQESKLRIVDLEGTPYQMGVTHGTALKAEITELVQRWKEDLAKSYRTTAADFIRKFLAATDFRPAIDRWTPGLLDEVRSIADGAGVDFDTMFAFLGRTLTDNSKTLDLATLKALYSDRSSGINNRGTYGCTIMILGKKPELHISPGRPDVEPFQVFDFPPRAPSR